jgi:hypothetical protein
MREINPLARMISQYIRAFGRIPIAGSMSRIWLRNNRSCGSAAQDNWLLPFDLFRSAD